MVAAKHRYLDVLEQLKLAEKVRTLKIQIDSKKKRTIICILIRNLRKNLIKQMLIRI
jgi:hypothetical protein